MTNIDPAFERRQFEPQVMPEADPMAARTSTTIANRGLSSIISAISDGRKAVARGISYNKERIGLGAASLVGMAAIALWVGGGLPKSESSSKASAAAANALANDPNDLEIFGSEPVNPLKILVVGDSRVDNLMIDGDHEVKNKAIIKRTFQDAGYEEVDVLGHQGDTLDRSDSKIERYFIKGGGGFESKPAVVVIIAGMAETYDLKKKKDPAKEAARKAVINDELPWDLENIRRTIAYYDPQAEVFVVKGFDLDDHEKGIKKEEAWSFILNRAITDLAEEGKNIDALRFTPLEIDPRELHVDLDHYGIHATTAEGSRKLAEKLAEMVGGPRVKEVAAGKGRSVKVKPPVVRADGRIQSADGKRSVRASRKPLTSLTKSDN